MLEGKGKHCGHTEILDEDFPVLDHLDLLPDQGVLVLQGLLGHRVEDPDLVEVGDARGLGQLLLQVLDIGVLGEVDLGRKTLDGLLGSCKRLCTIRISDALFFFFSLLFLFLFLFPVVYLSFADVMCEGKVKE